MCQGDLTYVCLLYIFLICIHATSNTGSATTLLLFSCRLQTALHKAAWYGYRTICHTLVEAGASLTRKDYQGNTPYYKAKQSGDKELSTYLKGKCATHMVTVSQCYFPFRQGTKTTNPHRFYRNSYLMYIFMVQKLQTYFCHFSITKFLIVRYSVLYTLCTCCP